MTYKASVIIPAYNEEEFIRTPLDALRGQKAQVIVVVGGNDDTESIAREHSATDDVIREDSPKGPGKARNIGFEKASGDILIFTDADTWVPKGWVSDHVQHHSDMEVVGVAGPSRPLGGEIKHRMIFKLTQDWWIRACRLFGWIQVRTTNFSVKKSGFESVDGFDEDMSYMEDSDLAQRLSRHGKIVFDPDLYVKTSTRRAENFGYLRLVRIYITDFVRRFLLGEHSNREYFDTIRKGDNAAGES